MQILHSTIRPRKIEKIFITHLLHGDHTLWIAWIDQQSLLSRGASPLEIYGPIGIEEFVRTVLKISQNKIELPVSFS